MNPKQQRKALNYNYVFLLLISLLIRHNAGELPIDVVFLTVLQDISLLQSEGSISSAASSQVIRTWRSRPSCPSPTKASPEWTQLAISRKAWRNPWPRPSTSPELCPSLTSSCLWKQGTRCASTWSREDWRTPRNLWPCLAECCCTRPPDWTPPWRNRRLLAACLMDSRRWTDSRKKAKK